MIVGNPYKLSFATNRLGGKVNPLAYQQLSHEKKKRRPLLSMKHWLFNRDPYSGL